MSEKELHLVCLERQELSGSLPEFLSRLAELCKYVRTYDCAATISLFCLVHVILQAGEVVKCRYNFIGF